VNEELRLVRRTRLAFFLGCW